MPSSSPAGVDLHLLLVLISNVRTQSIAFPAQLLLAFISFVQQVSGTSLKIQKIRMEEEEARLAELEKERQAKEAQAEGAPAEG